MQWACKSRALSYLYIEQLLIVKWQIYVFLKNPKFPNHIDKGH